MSEAAPMREWRFYVEDMLEFCTKALVYTQGLERANFRVDPMRYDATLRNLELIGEAASHVPPEIRASAPMSRGAWWWPHATDSSTAIWVSTTTRCGASSATICQL